MNEELKIIIKAVTDDINKKLDEVQKELEEVGRTAEETGKKVDEASDGMSESMKKAGAAITIAVGAITALVTAVMQLGQSSIEFQKAQARLISGFQGVGSSAKQATATYKELYSFLGETDTAVEAANLLAQITTEEKELAEWTNILKGVYATFPDSLPVEALAEATNETIKTGTVTGNLADALNWLGVSEDAVNQKLAEMNTLQDREIFLRDTLNGLYNNAAAIYDKNNASIIAMNNSQAELDIALAEATQYITPLLTSLAQMGAQLLQVVKPALETVAAAIIVFVQWIAAAAKAISNFFGGVSGKSSKAVGEVTKSAVQVKTAVSNATSGASGLNKALGGAAKAAKELKKQTMGFDELNVISSPTAAASGGSASGGVDVGAIQVPDIQIPDLSNLNLEEKFDFADKVAEVEKRIEAILVLAGLVGAAFAVWKISAIKDAALLLSKLKLIGGIAMIVAGAFLLIKGYTDAWANGIDWGNLTETLAGIGLIVGGMSLAFGSLAGAVSLLVGGIALVILAIVDFVNNGYSMEAVITLAIGAIAILVGAVWAFNAALLANPITWVVVAIMALVATFVILWNECEAFRHFWIELWDGIVAAFNAIVEWFKEAASAIAEFFVDAWEWIKEDWGRTKQFFSDVWQGIKNVFSAVGSWFSNIFSNAWQAIKNVFAPVGKFFQSVWNTITSTFKNIGNTVGSAISDGIKSAINWVLDKAVKIINGFIDGINWCIDIINAIPGVEISKISRLQVPKFAKGGVVESATLAVIGEQGKEAVVPLENNTEWMNKLADTIASRNNTPSKIVLMLDGNELGWANIHSINNITAQTGQLQLNVF